MLFTAPAAYAAPAAAAAAAPRRLPNGYHWGRCLLVVDGRTRISGRCAYRIEKGGNFQIAGPHQVYDGIDYPAANYGYQQRSADYWATVFRDGDGWSGYGNGDVRSTHGDRPWGALRREGACYANAQARICLWRQ